MARRPNRSPRRPPKPPAKAAESSKPVATPRFLLLFLALLVATLIAYQPAWHGTPVWDDDGHITRADLRSSDGLVRIWTRPGTTQQYYPVTHSAFWLQHRLWGDDPLGYHLVNIALHALSALLLTVILDRLRVPGAWLAAFIFALHPIHVESVAWITELKNTLSGVFYFAAALVYLQFDRTRRARAYGLASALFVLALLSKSVTATLPAGLLIVLWWQRGRLSWRQDILPLVPWFAAGAAAAVVTATVELTGIGAQGADFDLTPIERLLVAGRAIWFYAATIVWPVGLIFNYPRWEINQAAWWQYLFPIGVAAAVAALWLWRHRSRAPVAALLFFIVTSAPALGFVNVYPFLFSFVADHFVYLASAGIIAAGAAVLTRLATQWSRRSLDRRTGVMLIALVATTLGALTWRQSHQYANAETLYRTTIDRNPASWLARNNLAGLLLNGTPADVQEAAMHLQESVRLRHDNPVGHYNLGLAWQRLGRHDAAVSELRIALEQSAPTMSVEGVPGGNPLRMAHGYRYIGKSLLALGRTDDAIAALQRSVDHNPSAAATFVDLGIALMQTGRREEGLEQFRRAQQLEPAVADHHNNAGGALLQLGRVDEAAVHLAEAVRLNPRLADAHFNLGLALERLGQPQRAVDAYQRAIQSGLDTPDVRDALARAKANVKRQ